MSHLCQKKLHKTLEENAQLGTCDNCCANPNNIKMNLYFCTYPNPWSGKPKNCPGFLELFVLELSQPGVARDEIFQDGDGTGSGELNRVQPAGLQALGEQPHPHVGICL